MDSIKLFSRPFTVLDDVRVHLSWSPPSSPRDKFSNFLCDLILVEIFS